MKNLAISAIEYYKQCGPNVALIHQCNCFHKMKAGIANAVRIQFPGAFQADLSTEFGDPDKLGSFSMWRDASNKFVFNLYGQFRYGRDKQYTDYRAVEKGLLCIRNKCADLGVDHIIIPKGMGCMSAGGSWPIMESIIVSTFDDERVIVSLCEYLG
jgi:O-acetyl-ADP-ribose deacetylase (regulator of RNase III)